MHFVMFCVLTNNSTYKQNCHVRPCGNSLRGGEVVRRPEVRSDRWHIAAEN